MALCPLLNKECIKDECAWWHVKESGKPAACSVVFLPGQIADITERLDRAFSEISFRGERLLGNYADEKAEIIAEKNKQQK